MADERYDVRGTGVGEGIFLSSTAYGEVNLSVWRFGGHCSIDLTPEAALALARTLQSKADHAAATAEEIAERAGS